MIVVICGVIATITLTNITLRSIEKNLPRTLLTELNDLSFILENLSELVNAAGKAEAHPGTNNLNLLRAKTEALYNDIVKLRESYVFDNLVNASAFHAVVAPAIADLQIWLTDGVSGFKPDTETTASIVFLRINEAFQKARALNRDSEIRSQKILDEQRKRLERFLFGVNLLFALTILITFSMVYLLIRQYRLQHRESAAQAELRDQRDLLNSLFENVMLGITVWNKDGALLLSNRGFTEITGYSLEEIQTLDNWFIKAYPDPVYRKKTLAAWKESSFQKNDIREFRIACKNGTVKDIEWRVAFLSDGRALVSISDITDRKQDEEERRVLEERLQRVEKMEALGTLAGGVAHDLNNVLGVVIGYTELLLNSVDESDSIRPRLMNIMTGGQRAAAIVQDLLTLARRGVTSREVLNLNKIVADFQELREVRNFLSIFPSTSLKLDLDPGLLNICGSSVHLGKTLLNLVLNAGEAMPNGGILTIKTANQYLDKPIQGYDEVREGDYAVLSVSDTGEGISVRDMKHIFEPFYTKKVMGRSGTGLGLSVVWGTVKDHNGYIDVQSEEGKGSIFTLYFPVTREEAARLEKAASLDLYMSKGESILVVDDVKEQRELAESMLGKLGYRVETVSSGEDAVEYLKENSADLVVLDMIMDPGIDGMETYRRIIEITPMQKAVIVSGFSETDRVRKTQEMGAGAFVRKPYILEKIGLAVRKELDRK
ncbi:MAG: response regulator [Deltaproteobacteria bacterium]|nr:response regulator [Deltaproteobacteria bacterium]